jgi:hypothetical protein
MDLLPGGRQESLGLALLSRISADSEDFNFFPLDPMPLIKRQ